MTPFTKVLAVLNLGGAVLTLALLASTWFAKSTILGIARDKALESARPHTEAVATAMEKLAANPKVMVLVPKAAREKLEKELAAYQTDPDAWLMEAASKARERAQAIDLPEVKNPLAKAGVDYVQKKAGQAKRHYQKSMANLVLDLRIFSGTNAVACLIAAAVCFLARSPEGRRWATAWSCVLLLGTIFSVVIYVNQPWSWVILKNDYFGWSYLGVHAGATLYITLKFLELTAGSSDGRVETR